MNATLESTVKGIHWLLPRYKDIFKSCIKFGTVPRPESELYKKITPKIYHSGSTHKNTNIAGFWFASSQDPDAITYRDSMSDQEKDDIYRTNPLFRKFRLIDELLHPMDTYFNQLLYRVPWIMEEALYKINEYFKETAKPSGTVAEKTIDMPNTVRIVIGEIHGRYGEMSHNKTYAIMNRDKIVNDVKTKSSTSKQNILQKDLLQVPPRTSLVEYLPNKNTKSNHLTITLKQPKVFSFLKKCITILLDAEAQFLYIGPTIATVIKLFLEAESCLTSLYGYVILFSKPNSYNQREIEKHNFIGLTTMFDMLGPYISHFVYDIDKRIIAVYDMKSRSISWRDIAVYHLGFGSDLKTPFGGSRMIEGESLEEKIKERSLLVS